MLYQAVRTALFIAKPKTLFNDPIVINKYSLDLPNSAKLALKLKIEGIVSFDEVPLSKEELIALLQAGDSNE